MFFRRPWQRRVEGNLAVDLTKVTVTVCECCHLVGVLETTVRKPGGADGVLCRGKRVKAGAEVRPRFLFSPSCASILKI